jgi:hypothetical protein
VAIEKEIHSVSDGRLSRLERYVIGGLLAMNAVAIALVVRHALFPYPADISDGGILSSSWQIVTRGPIYNEISRPPYVFNIHNPAFIYLSALVIHLFGPHPAGPRILAEVMLLGAAFWVYLSVRSTTGSRPAALIAALFLPVERYVVKRTGLATCDQSALFFSTLGMYLWLRGDGWRRASPAAFALGFFSKQGAVFAPLACLGAMLLRGRMRTAAAFALVWVGLIAAGVATCYGIWGKPFIVNTFVYMFEKPFAMSRGLGQTLGFAAHYPLAILAAIWGLRRARLDERAAAIGIYALTGAISGLMSGIEGASPSYVFDLAAALAMSMGLFWPEISGRFAATKGGARVVLAAALAAQGILVVEGVIYRGHVLWGRAHATAEDARRAALYDEAGAIVLDEMPGYDFGRAGRAYSTDAHQFAQMMRSGAVPADALVREVEQRTFSAVVVPVTAPRWSVFDERLRDAVRRNYSLKEKQPNEDLYVRE